VRLTQCRRHPRIDQGWVGLFENPEQRLASLPERYSVFVRFTRLSKIGVWDAAFDPGESWATSRQGACHRFHDRAGSPACSRCKRGNQNQEALGRSRGGFSTKIHLRANAKGNPLTFDVTGGEAHEVKGYDALMELHHERIRALPGVIAWHAALTPPSHSQRTGKQKIRYRAHLFAARRKLPAVGSGPLFTQPQLHQLDHRRQTARVAVARH
jgi:hypothetical protein